MQGIVALSAQELEFVSGGSDCVYAEAKLFWEGVAIFGALLGQPEVVAAALIMVAYNDYMEGKYCD